MTGASIRFLIALAALQLAPGTGTIAGIVIKAGTAIEQPLPNARLELSGGPGAPVVLRTDGNGKFVFSSLAAGEYRLAVTCDGFIRQVFPKRIVLGRGQQAGNMRFELEPAPTAGGRVLDSYGQPIDGIMVEALRRSYDVRGNPRFTRAATALTDDRGEYRIFWLDPGQYFFYAAAPLPDPADPQPPPVVTPTYAPGVSAPEDAKPLRLDIAREVRVDFRLPRAGLWSVKGHTMNGITGRSVAASIALTAPSEDPSFSRFSAQSTVTGLFPGVFSIDKVPPGSYIIVAKSGSGDQETTAFQRIVLRPVLIPPLDGYGIYLALSLPVSINGRLFVESREAVDLRDARVTLISVDPDLPSPRSVSARSDGQFILNGAAPGTYVLETSNLPQDLYLKAARFGDADILDKPLTLEARAAANPLQILLGSDGGHLQVAAYNNKGELHSGAQVVVVPDAPRRDRREQYRVATSGDDGTALLSGIPPGSYRLFAWEDLEPNGYLNPEYLAAYEAYGVPVKIVAGENPPVSARLIPKE